MYIATIPNRSSPPAILLRESYRQEGQVKTRTLANLTSWPPAQLDALRRVLRGDPLVGPDDTLEIVRSLPHGHVAAVLGTVRRLGLDTMIAAKKSWPRQLVLAMIVARILAPQSKLATARGLGPDTASTSLGTTLHVEAADADALYAAMDWLLRRQPQIEAALAARHLAEGTLVLCDLTSTYFEGHTCPLAQFGHSRDGKKGKVQIVFGLICNAGGCPVAVEVFTGNTADPQTLAPQLRKLREQFPLPQCVLVGDRGLLTNARIHAIVRRSKGHAQSVIITGDLVVNLDQKTVEVDGARVHLTGKEYQMLELLSLRKGTTLTKEMFLNHLYGGMDEPELKIIDVFICKLRKKLAMASNGRNYIETVWGRGYVLREPSPNDERITA